MDECRRCPTRIVELANNLIGHNAHRSPRQLTSMSGNPEGEIHVVQWPSLELEARAIAWFIQHKINNGDVEQGSVLVLAPRRQIGYAVRDALEELGVAAHSFFREQALDGNQKDLNACGAQSAFTLLALLVNRDDRVALRCWCGFGSPSLRSGAWERLRKHSTEQDMTPKRALEKLADGRLSLTHMSDLVERYRLLQQQLNRLDGLVGTPLLDALLPANADWAANLRSLAESVEEDEHTAETLLDTLRVGITQPELPTDVDYVRIMSPHKAKGLTADLVVVCGCIEGLIPHVDYGLPPAAQERELAEQRRMFYVAITRARQVLVLSSVIAMERGPGHRMRAQLGRGDRQRAGTLASRFLRELGPTCPEPLRGDQWLRLIEGDEVGV